MHLLDKNLWTQRYLYADIASALLVLKLSPLFLGKNKWNMEQSAETIFGCCASQPSLVKFIYSEEAKKIEEIFTIDLTTVTAYCQIDVEDFSIFVAFSENVNFTELHAPF